MTDAPAWAMVTMTAQIPIELPYDLAVKMARAFYALDGVFDDERMRAAYRVFLDNLP